MDWDYTKLAKHYDKRPDYSSAALNSLFQGIDLDSNWSVVDMGAGTGKITRQLVGAGCKVTAVEPNAAMRGIGMENVPQRNCRWLDATAENSGLADDSCDLVIFGSSFNVVDQHKALLESARLLRSDGWFACLWNHRDLTDAIQREVEAIIHAFLPHYEYGRRRQDQARVIDDSGLFATVGSIEEHFLHRMDVAAYVDAWRSHGTLARQAGDLFPEIIHAIERQLEGLETMVVPYHTRIWYARKR